MSHSPALETPSPAATTPSTPVFRGLSGHGSERNPSRSPPPASSSASLQSLPHQSKDDRFQYQQHTHEASNRASVTSDRSKSGDRVDGRQHDRREDKAVGREFQLMGVQDRIRQDFADVGSATPGRSSDAEFRHHSKGSHRLSTGLQVSLTSSNISSTPVSGNFTDLQWHSGLAHTPPSGGQQAPHSPGALSWAGETAPGHATSSDKSSETGAGLAPRLSRKESYKAQRQHYRREKKRAASALLSSLEDPAVVILADWLKVRGSLKSWTKLWCVLKPGLLLLYKSPKAKSSHWVGTVLLTACQVIERPSKKDGFCFKLYHPMEQSIWAPRGPHNETIGAVVQPLPTAHLIFRAPSQAAGKCWLDGLELALKCSSMLLGCGAGAGVGVPGPSVVRTVDTTASHETQWSPEDLEKHFHEHAAINSYPSTRSSPMSISQDSESAPKTSRIRFLTKKSANYTMPYAPSLPNLKRSIAKWRHVLEKLGYEDSDDETLYIDSREENALLMETEYDSVKKFSDMSKRINKEMADQNSETTVEASVPRIIKFDILSNWRKRHSESGGNPGLEFFKRNALRTASLRSRIFASNNPVSNPGASPTKHFRIRKHSDATNKKAAKPTGSGADTETTDISTPEHSNVKKKSKSEGSNDKNIVKVAVDAGNFFEENLLKIVSAFPKRRSSTPSVLLKIAGDENKNLGEKHSLLGGSARNADSDGGDTFCNEISISKSGRPKLDFSSLVRGKVSSDDESKKKSVTSVGGRKKKSSNVFTDSNDGTTSDVFEQQGHGLTIPVIKRRQIKSDSAAVTENGLFSNLKPRRDFIVSGRNSVEPGMFRDSGRFKMDVSGRRSAEPIMGGRLSSPAYYTTPKIDETLGDDEAVELRIKNNHPSVSIKTYGAEMMETTPDRFSLIDYRRLPSVNLGKIRGESNMQRRSQQCLYVSGTIIKPADLEGAEMTDSESDGDALGAEGGPGLAAEPPPSPALDARRLAARLEAMYEDEPTDDVGQCGEVVEELGEENKSLLWFLVKQVRPGMDLSKVVLPTFVLEPRSFLDKLSDSFYHADILARAWQFKGPFERMRAVTAWYMSGLYRKPRGLKKPYNPVLGETFRCRWRHPGSNTNTYYVAEQVSHHPPLSAFYVSNRKEGFTIEASILAKSKFYGNSTSAILEGQARVTLLPLAETYLCTSPYAHCKGLLMGTLSMELGGRVTITCPDTNYSSEIEFRLKPFLGGADSTNMVSGRIRHHKETVATIEGHWDSRIDIKDKRTQTTSVLLDVAELKTQRLKRQLVRPDILGDFESQRLWLKVSTAIANDDQVAATEEKTVIEEAQRERARAHGGRAWSPRYFRRAPCDDGNSNHSANTWQYNFPNLAPWDDSVDVLEYESDYVVRTLSREQSLPEASPLHGAGMLPETEHSASETDSTNSHHHRPPSQGQTMAAALLRVEAALREQGSQLAGVRAAVGRLEGASDRAGQPQAPAWSGAWTVLLAALLLQAIVFWFYKH